MGDLRPLKRLGQAVATTVLLLVVGACSSDQGVIPLLHLTNGADRDVDVFLMHPDTGQESMFQEDIGVGETSEARSDVYPGASCSSLGVLVARDKGGIEVARRTGRICPGDAWTIEVSPPSP